jgi:predicted nuclease with TOPRIM domain
MENLMSKVAQLEQQKVEMNAELLMFQSTKKEELKKLIKIQKLESQMSEISEKLKNVETEKQKLVEDMAWAQNYYSGVDKKIKDLEAELSNYKTDQSDSNDKTSSSMKSGNLVKLKIRKNEK